MGTVPYVIERIKGGERSYDTYSRVLKERIVCDHVANEERF
jgi:hypothetical protein